MKFVKDLLMKHLALIVIGVLFLVMWSRGCFNRGGQEAPKITIVRDTVYIHHDSTILTKPEIIATIPAKQIPPTMIPDTNYYKLKAQYEDLLNKYLAINVQKDSIKVDTLGVVKVTDSVNQNKVIARQWDYNLRERVITNTITKTLPVIKHNQVYVGTELQMSTNDLINQAAIGLFLKNKSNDIFGASFGYDFRDKSQNIGFKYYKLISFKGKSP